MEHSRGAEAWEGAKMIAVQRADAIITIAGLEKTYLNGLAAIVSRKKLVPIGTFGGASEKLIEDIQKLGDAQRRNDFASLNAPWTPHLLETTMRLTGMMEFPRVLIIHGHGRNPDKAEYDYDILREWLRNDGFADNNVIVMKESYGVGMTLPEKLESLASSVDAAIALATPDDVGRLKTDTSLNDRARQNVWLEFGWFWGRLGRDKILLLFKGTIEEPSDMRGLEYLTYADSPVQEPERIRTFLRRRQGIQHSFLIDFRRASDSGSMKSRHRWPTPSPVGDRPLSFSQSLLSR